MPFSDSDLQRLAYLTRLDQGLMCLGADPRLDLRRARVALPSLMVRADFRRGRWIYRWGPWPWCRVDANHENAAERVYQAMRLI